MLKETVQLLFISYTLTINQHDVPAYASIPVPFLCIFAGGVLISLWAFNGN